MPTVFLFSFKEYIQLVSWDANPAYVNWPMIQYDIKCYKGVTNTLDFVIRNNERRPVNLVGLEMECVIQNQNNGQIMLTKPVEVTVPLQGKARLTLDPGDIEDWTANYYDYTVRVTNVNGVQQLFYTDINKTATGNFQLFDGVLRAEVPSTEILAAQFTQTPLGLADDIMFLSGAYPGDAQVQKAGGLHTVAVYQTKWIGSFFIQASLQNDSPLPQEWFYIPLGQNSPFYIFDHTNNGDDGPTLFNFSCNAYWVRFGFIPVWAGDQNPITVRDIATLVVNDGVFHKVLYKN
jgi:hypothetical protein